MLVNINIPQWMEMVTLKSNLETAAAVGGAALAVSTAVTGIGIAVEHGAADRAASIASVLPGIDQADLAQLMTSDDSALAHAVRAARNVIGEATLGLAAFQN
jgi:hypothetical protein